MRKLSNKKIATVIVGAVAFSGVGVAYAYWTSTGSGTGSASVAAAAEVLTVHQTADAVVLTPGGPAQALSGNFDNPNTGTIKVTQVSVTIEATDWQNGCSEDDYTLVQPDAQTSTNTLVASGDAVGSWAGGSVKLDDRASVDQDGCKGQVLTLTYSAS